MISLLFFFSSRRRHTRCGRDWSSDVCSSDLGNQIPIIMLTAKGDEASRIQGLEQGADDYLSKPFNPRELLARINAVLRRHKRELPGAPSGEETVIEFGEFWFNLATREMRRGTQPMTLTSGEFAVLKALVTHP